MRYLLSIPGVLPFLVVLVCAAIGCGNADDRRKDASEYPVLPASLREELLNTCDYIDIIFFNSPLSMSQDEARAIEGTLGFISESPAVPVKTCTPLGRISFMANGTIIAEADAYHSPECAYFIFLVDEEPAYCNAMTERGIQFYQSLQPYINTPQ